MLTGVLIFLCGSCWPDEPARNPVKKSSAKNLTGP